MNIARNVWVKIGKHRILAVAAGFAFYAILAIFPAITAFVSIYGLFADASRIERHLSLLTGIFPGGAIEVIGDQVNRIVNQGSDTLGFAFAIGLLSSIWSANAGMKAMFDALNVAYEGTESRGFFALNAISLLFTVAMVGFSFAAFAATIGVPLALEYVHLETPWLATLFAWSRWPLLIIVLVLALSLLYRYGPAREKPAWRWVAPGTVFASVAWLAASTGFSWYAQNFASYNKTYGALGAAVGFMTWIWVSATVIMVGAELNAETERDAKDRPPVCGPLKQR